MLTPTWRGAQGADGAPTTGSLARLEHLDKLLPLLLRQHFGNLRDVLKLVLDGESNGLHECPDVNVLLRSCS